MVFSTAIAFRAGSVAPPRLMDLPAAQESGRSRRYCVFLTSGHLDSDNGWNAASAGIVATSL
jgi:hypothetical protein